MKLVVLVVILSAIIIRHLAAQVTTGRIIGTVRDASGAVLRGAVVTVSSPALLGGAASSSTNEKDTYRFPSLAPGRYVLEASLQGFETYKEEGIRVLLGGTVQMDVTLALAGVSEQLTVTAPQPTVDPQEWGVSTNYGTEVIENIPRQRMGMRDFLKMAPGISATRPTSQGSRYVSAFGSGVDENAYVVDGADLTSPYNGGFDLSLDPDVIEEIEIQTSGVSAEHGNIQGAVFNVLTKSGSNDWRFDVSYYNQNPVFQSQPIKHDCW